MCETALVRTNLMGDVERKAVLWFKSKEQFFDGSVSVWNRAFLEVQFCNIVCKVYQLEKQYIGERE